jgi:hypothetical protein
MNDFYPNGALKGRDKLESLIEQRHKKSSTLYLATFGKPTSGTVKIYKLFLGPKTQITNGGHYWWIANESDQGTLGFRINTHNEYLESNISGGYVFNNFWRVYAYTLHLKQSGFFIDWRFPLAVG